MRVPLCSSVPCMFPDKDPCPMFINQSMGNMERSSNKGDVRAMLLRVSMLGATMPPSSSRVQIYDFRNKHGTTTRR